MLANPSRNNKPTFHRHPTPLERYSGHAGILVRKLAGEAESLVILWIQVRAMDGPDLDSTSWLSAAEVQVPEGSGGASLGGMVKLWCVRGSNYQGLF